MIVPKSIKCVFESWIELNGITYNSRIYEQRKCCRAVSECVRQWDVYCGGNLFLNNKNVFVGAKVQDLCGAHRQYDGEIGTVIDVSKVSYPEWPQAHMDVVIQFDGVKMSGFYYYEDYVFVD